LKESPLKSSARNFPESLAELAELAARRQEQETSFTTVVVIDLRTHRNTLGISQSRLARLSGVSRFKICLYELGDGCLSEEEWKRIGGALQAEAERLREISTHFDSVGPGGSND